jgi:glycosyltransferase involved in cell wall biosynthesis
MSSKTTTKILYLSYDGLTDPLGQSQILPYMLGLSARDFDITIISFEKPSAFKRERNSIDAAINGQLCWIPLVYHKSPPVISTLWDIWTLWNVVKRQNKEKRFTIIHCRSYITSLIGLQAKRKWGTKFIFDMRGFWADERVEGRLWNLKNPVFKSVYLFFKRKEKQFLQEADHIVSLTFNAKAEIESWDLGGGPISVIPTCVDIDLFDPSKIELVDQRRLRTKLNISETDFVLLYLGSWGTWYLTDEMLSFFARLKSTRANTKFLIVSGDQIDLKNYHLKNDVIITTASREIVPLLISLAHMSVALIKPSFSKKASSATKLGELMAMNIPVITNTGWGDIELILAASRAFDYSLSTNLETFLGKLARTNQGREYCANNLSLQTGVDAYLAIYSNVSA